jgi:hypothetical protein
MKRRRIMQNTQEIQQCIDHCNQLANDLRAMSKNNQNPNVGDKLFEAAHHIDLCVTECGYAVQKPQMATAMR